MRRRKIVSWGLLALVSLTVSLAAAQQRFLDRPLPDRVNVRYGSHHRHRLDFWSAGTDQPSPLLVYIHGGGFQGGDKRGIPVDLLQECLQSGISVASINYRLSQHASFPAPMLDGARAVQFLRFKAKDWNIDPERIAASGGSAGAGVALWVGFQDDLKNPESEDPVDHQSSRLSCVAVFGAQTTYDPRVIATIVGGRAHEHPALTPFFGLTKEHLETEEAYRRYQEASPDTYVTADDPPVYLVYNEPKGSLPPDAPPGKGIHHPNFGTYLASKLHANGIECLTDHVDDLASRGKTPHHRMVEFCCRHFGIEVTGEDSEN
ncbi:alpha/beta hydrolase [Tautonia marina]|uniref:alpha/beta hydrolase n=1 Tax=Tautonia marina TaxID=2653855 RepID=UPI001260FCE4|nr:alpha/beta hydrolase [Tautonia marina]